MSLPLFNKANSLYDSNRAFVLYRKPGEDLLHLLSQNNDTLHHLNDYKESGFLIAPFAIDKKPFLIHADLHETAPYSTSQNEAKFNSVQIDETEEAQQRHLTLVSKAVEVIETGIIKKVVVSRRIALPYLNIPFNAFRHLLNRHGNAFIYIWFHPKLGCWLGASPELLVSVNKDRLLTYSLAGTMPYQKDKIPEWGFKEREEQQLVTDYILQKLKQIGLQAQATGTKSSKAGNLWHLKTEIQGTGDELILENILKVLHPTPAVCGEPKTEALRFIDQYEEYDRKFYTGFLGELNLDNNTQSALYVNLRCMEWRDNTAYVYVGGGITTKSSPEAEWHETRHKSQTIIEALFNSGK